MTTKPKAPATRLMQAAFDKALDAEDAASAANAVEFMAELHEARRLTSDDLLQKKRDELREDREKEGIIGRPFGEPNRAPYFDDESLRNIKTSFVAKVDLNERDFRQSLERCAWLYKRAEQISDEIKRTQRYGRKPAEKALRGAIRRAAKLASDALRDPYLASAVGWRNLQQIEAATPAASRAQTATPSAFNDLFWALCGLYKTAAANPRTPTGRDTKEGEPIAFLRAVMVPLGVDESKLTSGALRSAWRRLMGQ